MRSCIPGTDMIEKCSAAIEEQAAVDFVGQDHDVAVANRFGDLLDVPALENSASGILRRI